MWLHDMDVVLVDGGWIKLEGGDRDVLTQRNFTIRPNTSARICIVIFNTISEHQFEEDTLSLYL